MACRSSVNFKRPSQAEAYKQAVLVVSGKVAAVRLDPKKFDYKYTLTIDKTWKGQIDASSLEFLMEHHTCAKYRSIFESEGVGYFNKVDNKWQLLRFASSEDQYDLKKELEELSGSR